MYLNSRIHPLHHFSAHNSAVFIKRDDELSAGISGCKYRKYSSIIPFLIKNKIKHVYIIGSTHSNNVLAALQCCRENSVNVTALLLKPHNEITQGNFKLSQMFLEEKDIIWIDRSKWHTVNQLAKTLSKANDQPSYILYEGGMVKEGISGAKSLCLDILVNETENKIHFDHIFFDAGTGFSASCCIKGLEEVSHTAKRYVLLLAGEKEEIITQNQALTGVNFSNTLFLTPSNAKSFGSINQTVKKYIKKFAYQHGVLLDPLYSAKLFYETEKYIHEKKLLGSILIIHSGGILSLPNFNF